MLLYYLKKFDMELRIAKLSKIKKKNDPIWKVKILHGGGT